MEDENPQSQDTKQTKQNDQPAYAGTPVCPNCKRPGHTMFNCPFKTQIRVEEPVPLSQR